MTDSVVQLVKRHAAATEAASKRYCDPFISTKWIVIELASALDLSRRCIVNMQAARIQESLGGMVSAQRELDRLLAQSQQLSETIARVLKAHAARGGGM